MDIKKREKIAMGSYSVANVCLRGIKVGSQIIALIYVMGFGASLIGDFQTKKIRKINSKR